MCVSVYVYVYARACVYVCTVYAWGAPAHNGEPVHHMGNLFTICAAMIPRSPPFTPPFRDVCVFQSALQSIGVCVCMCVPQR